MSVEVLSLGYLFGDRYLVVLLDNHSQIVSLKKLRTDAWNDVVVRLGGGKSTLVVNGAPVASPRSILETVQNNAPPAEVISTDSLTVGNRRTHDLPWRGKLSYLAIWNTPLPDERIAALCAVPRLNPAPAPPKDARKRWLGYYDEGIAADDAWRRLYEDELVFFRRALQSDPWFPRFHLTIPGCMTEPSAASEKSPDGYHLFPHDCIHWTFLFPHRANHNWRHIHSPDLVRWSPLPNTGFESPRSGNILALADKSVAFPTPHLRRDGSTVYERWVSTDALIKTWQQEGEVVIPPAPDAKGVVPQDHYLFRRDGKVWMIAGYAAITQKNPALAGRVELYCATDDQLRHWSYEGVFYQGRGKLSHHPRLFLVDGHCVLDSDVSIDDDRDAWYLLGSIKDNRFVREGGGHFQFGTPGAPSWGQTITEPDGRVLRWTHLLNLTTPRNLVSDNLRRGWSNVYSIPRVMRVEKGRLTQHPVPELARLRQDHLLHSTSQQLQPGKQYPTSKNAGHGALEARLKLRVPEKGRAGIVLQTAPDDQVRFLVDSDRRKLVLAFDRSQSGGRNGVTSMSKNAETSLVTPVGGEIELILYFDRSIIEAFGEGQCTSGTWHTAQPDQVQAGWISEDTTASLLSGDIWQLGTAWELPASTDKASPSSKNP